MKATVDIPDPLYRQVKARAALEGRAIRDVTIELYERWLEGDLGLEQPGVDRTAEAEAWLRAWEEITARIGTTTDGSPSALDILLADRR